MSTTVSSPFPFTGETIVGVVSLEFTDGVAVFDGTLSQDSANLLRSNGFTVNAPLIGDAEDAVAVGAVEPAAPEDTRPALNASKSDWDDYAVSQGHDRGSLDELTRNEIRDLFTE